MTPDLPVQAFMAFERITGLSLAVHVLDLGLWPFLPSAYAWHRQSVCVAAKAWGKERCQQFDGEVVRAALRRRPEGMLKICHAHLLEWVVPVGPAAAPRLVLFAGPARASGALEREGVERFGLLRPDSAAPALPPQRLPRLPERMRERAIGPDEAADHLELLRQLAARLTLWLGELDEAPGPARFRSAVHEADRRQAIEWFVLLRHRDPIQIADLAARLGLSPGRMAHVVRDCCGRSFGTLLTETRVRTAASLLLHTELAIPEVAVRSGFGDTSNFHRRFRQHRGVSPLQFRKQAVAVITPLSVAGQPVG